MRCRLVGQWVYAGLTLLTLTVVCVLCPYSLSADVTSADVRLDGLYSGGGASRSGDDRLHTGILGGSFESGVLQAGGYILMTGPFRTPALPPPGIAGDFNGDASVDFTDFLLFAAAYGSSSGDAGFDPLYDLDGRGSVDFADFVAFAQVYGG